MTNQKLLAKTFYGFETLLSRELKKLGAINVKEHNRMVSFEGDTGFIYKTNLCARTALKVLKPIAEFRVKNAKELYKKAVEIPWTSYFEVNQTFAIDSLVFSDLFNNSMFVSQVVKDAIVDNFRDKTGLRPNVNSHKTDIPITVHLQDNLCTISLDSSGASLHQRGYRQQTNLAPINEVLAAGLLLKAGWQGKRNFLDPMCGSGTFLIEAAMIACNIPPNLNREDYAFMRWKDFNSELFQTIRDGALRKVQDFPFKIYGYDKAPSAVRKAQMNVEAAHLDSFITVEKADFFKEDRPILGPLFLAMNPPYGERLAIDEEEFYASIGSTLKHSYSGTEAWILSGNLDAFKYVGLRPSQKVKTFNGKIESRWQQYLLFEGKRKESMQANK